MQCAKCQTPLLPEDQFCPNCGQPVVQQAPSADHFPPHNNQTLSVQKQSILGNLDQLPRWMLFGGIGLLVVICFGMMAVGGHFLVGGKNRVAAPETNSESVILQATVFSQETTIADQNPSQEQSSPQQESASVEMEIQPAAEAPRVKVWIDTNLMRGYQVEQEGDYGGLILQTTSPTGSIMIIPAASLSAALPDSDEIFNLDDLAQSIAAPDMETFAICLPVPGGACEFLGFNPNVVILDFQSGSGIRAASIWTDETIEYSNDRLDYYFYGLTADRQFYITAGFDLDHPFLEGKDWVFKENDPNFDIDDFDTITESVFVALSRPDGYEPELASIDAVIRSLRVEN